MQDEILDFWFGPRDSAAFGESRTLWFRKDDAVDRSIRERFGSAVETALAGGFGDWLAPRHALARVLLLDQFTRNIFRETARAFAGDKLALDVSKATVDSARRPCAGPRRTLVSVHALRARRGPRRAGAVVGTLHEIA